MKKNEVLADLIDACEQDSRKLEILLWPIVNEMTDEQFEKIHAGIVEKMRKRKERLI